MKLERSCSTAAHWTESQYQQAIQGRDVERSVLVAEDESRGIAGFLVALHVAAEWELENIVVAPASRRAGLATRLMNAFFDYVRQVNSEAVFLEVRASNLAARTLYEKCAFLQSGQRRAYYSDPVEDAILYRRDFP
jgi:ribosomal-protein-alanine N-acetyltransferase